MKKNIGFHAFYEVADEMFYNWGICLTPDGAAHMFKEWEKAGRPDLASFLYNNFT